MNLKHGDAKVGAVSRLHSIWRGIKKRCNKALTHSYAHKWYAAKGIGLCEEWSNYAEFKKWAMANGYADHLSIDRIDVNKGYSPENCQWADSKQQCRNRTSSRFIVVNGERKTIAEWAEIKGIRQGLISLRLNRGWKEADAVQIPPKAIRNWRIPASN